MDDRELDLRFRRIEALLKAVCYVNEIELDRNGFPIIEEDFDGKEEEVISDNNKVKRKDGTE